MKLGNQLAQQDSLHNQTPWQEPPGNRQVRNAANIFLFLNDNIVVSVSFC